MTRTSVVERDVTGAAGAAKARLVLGVERGDQPGKFAPHPEAR